MKILHIFLLFSVVTIVSCKKDDISGNADNIPGLGGDTWVNGPIDDWIFSNYTGPYNVDVKYKWSQTELSELDKNVVPIDESQVIPVMSAIKQVWIEPYEAEAGPQFMKKYMPRFIILEGSPSYNSDGTFTLGQAEGEGRILLFDMNNFRTKSMPGYVPADSFAIKQVFHTIEHEFGHTLHANILYPQEFKTITGGYTSNWNNVSEQAAHEMGFISSYAMNNADDDFVETISIMLVEGRVWFNQMVAGVQSEEARNQLKQKEATVVNYFKNSWNIDYYSLQTRTRTVIDGFVK
jgi:substrate import-associated zinc metallohydrolase lipoprotein